MFKKLFLFFFLFFPSLSMAASELPFTDVSIEDLYYTDLKYMYNAGIISDNSNHLFHPNGLLPRDEFAGTVVGVSCQKCITPSVEDIIHYNTNPFVDVLKKNQYFYCISYAKEKEIARWYVLDATGKTQCQDDKTFSEVPFCPANNVTRIEAAAVLLRQSGLWDETQNNSSYMKKVIMQDVDMYWYGYAQKAVQTGLIFIDKDGKIFPDEYITRKEFVVMASKIYAINMCSVKESHEPADFGSIIKIFDKNKKNCSESQAVTTFQDSTATTYDFGGYVAGSVTLPATYNWTFTNVNTNEQITATGSCLDNFDLVSAGLWSVKLVTSDTTGHSSTAYQEVFVKDNNPLPPITNPDNSNDPFASIIKIFDKDKTSSSKNPNITTFPDNTETIYDFGGYATGTLSAPLTYNWTFTNTVTGEQKFATGSYLDNFDLVSAGLWSVKLVTSDATGHSSTAYQEVFVQANGISTQIGIPSDSIQGIIKIFDTEKQNCSPTDNVTVFPDNTQTIYDFGGYANETLIPPLTYNWTFINSITGEQKLANGNCLNNYNLWSTGLWTVKLIITDVNNLNTTVYQEVFVQNYNNTLINTGGTTTSNPSNKTDNPLTTSSSTLYGTIGVPMPFFSTTAGWDGNYSYEWNFWDGGNATLKDPLHTFMQEGVYPVSFIVRDTSGNIAYAQLSVIIIPNLDRDKDWILDYDTTGNIQDVCPDVFGPASNKGCPVVNEYNSNETIINNLCLTDKIKTSGMIEWSVQCVSCPCAYSSDFVAQIRSCDIIFPSITSPDKKILYSRGGIYSVP